MFKDGEITYLLTRSMQHSPSWEVNKFSASQEIPRIFGTRRFITAFTSARHLSLSQATPIQSISPHPTSWRSILMLSYHLCLGLPSGLFPSGFPTNTLYTPLLTPCTCYMPSPSHSSRLYHPNNIVGEEQILSPSLCSFLHSPVTSSLFGPNILPNTLFSTTLSLYSSLNVLDQRRTMKKKLGKNNSVVPYRNKEQEWENRRNLWERITRMFA